MSLNLRSSVPASSPSYRGSGVLIPLFITAHTFVWIGSTIVLLTVFLSSRIYRHPTWTNLNLSWILACFSFSCLFTTGQLYNPRPSFPVCLVQASAIYSVPSLTSGATLAVAISLFLRIRNTGTRRREIDPQVQRTRTLVLVLTPYILPTIIFFGVLIFGLQHKDQVTLADNWMVCGLKNPVFGRATDLLVAAIMVPTVTIGLWTIIYLYRSTAASLGRKIIHLLAKLGIFTLFGIFGTIVSSIFSFVRFAGVWQSAIANVLLALPPLSYIFLFGLQKDILLVWAFWRRQEEDNFQRVGLRGNISKGPVKEQERV
ncbi:hypothetical protein Moror_6741 [Moniliophthora roreri MCA 2997]|uniref:G-protein coupled receptors family 2 profile 2 domain-containing protein n=1 Tax=Moniliophthora roreri (strain MCA 2997) TaxID=1381753 RepID=V2YYF8_MONRO|nr:hypothetical protein Moror_6741 [Moniliophthora roreri MCA 2997]